MVFMLSQRVNKTLPRVWNRKERSPVLGALSASCKEWGRKTTVHEALNKQQKSVASGEPCPVFTERVPQWWKATESLKHRSKNTLNSNGVKLEGPEGRCKTCLQALGLERDLPGLLQL